MLIASCPKCNDKVTVPDGVNMHAVVRCPLCREEYDLAAVLDRIPPALEILEVPGQADALEDEAIGDSAFGDRLFGAAMIGSTDDEGGLATMVDMETAESGFDFTGAAPSKSSPSFKASPRPKKKQKSAVAEIAKIAGGGIVGVVLAVLIMWWGLGRDPFQFGPKVGAISGLKWIVPVKFQPATDNELPDDESVSVGNSTSSVSAGTARNNNSGVGRPSQNGAKSNTPNKTNGSKSVEPTPDNTAMPEEPPFGIGIEPAEDPFGLAASDPLLNPTPELASTDLTIPTPELSPDLTSIDSTPPISPAPTASDAGEPTLVGVRGASPVSAQQLGKALAEVAKAADAWKEADEATNGRKRELAALYRALAGTGHAAVFLDAQDAESPKRIDAMMRQLNDLAQQSELMEKIGPASTQWIELSQRPSDGVAMVGTVTEIAAKDALFEIKLKIAGSEDKMVDLVSFADPADGFSTGDRLLVLGALVADPKSNLAGYAGESPLVAVIGMPVKLPSE